MTSTSGYQGTQDGTGETSGKNTSAEGSSYWKQEMAIRLGRLGSLDSPSLSTLCSLIFCFLCNQT